MMSVHIAPGPVPVTAPAAAPSAPLDTRALRGALGQFATGVTVVTYEHAGTTYGATVNSFTSVSMDPPLVLVSFMRSSGAAVRLPDTPFSINILHDSQNATAWHFAGRPQDDHSVEWVVDGVAPRLADSLAYVTCTPWAQYDGGDHVLIVGRVESFGAEESVGETGRAPLLFFRGGWRALAR
ncbi:flavin reductase family protein [Klugiella xanthotipulae]|uniref:Flavin reductase (DIM6/NTAB) family NADH-FMN oxidoreductase RutF n=1 Tax=Klugiella xanthotipulae TaxID=244735 RepID=A0A543HZ30_9MICO|nr:flavin reductase family protein [Klugiella xanthotipulae]TQM63515.1 flavin reductase (DIM6/NTAB) family NADH-FMN oxidoreductase RutF [Klugiella xanthotipulae]